MPHWLSIISYPTHARGIIVKYTSLGTLLTYHQHQIYFFLLVSSPLLVAPVQFQHCKLFRLQQIIGCESIIITCMVCFLDSLSFLTLRINFQLENIENFVPSIFLLFTCQLPLPLSTLPLPPFPCPLPLTCLYTLPPAYVVLIITTYNPCSLNSPLLSSCIFL